MSERRKDNRPIPYFNERFERADLSPSLSGRARQLPKRLCESQDTAFSSSMIGCSISTANMDHAVMQMKPSLGRMKQMKLQMTEWLKSCWKFGPSNYISMYTTLNILYEHSGISLAFSCINSWSRSKTRRTRKAS